MPTVGRLGPTKDFKGLRGVVQDLLRVLRGFAAGGAGLQQPQGPLPEASQPRAALCAQGGKKGAAVGCDLARGAGRVGDARHGGQKIGVGNL